MLSELPPVTVLVEDPANLFAEPIWHDQVTQMGHGLGLEQHVTEIAAQVHPRHDPVSALGPVNVLPKLVRKRRMPCLRLMRSDLQGDGYESLCVSLEVGSNKRPYLLSSGHFVVSRKRESSRSPGCETVWLARSGSFCLALCDQRPKATSSRPPQLLRRARGRPPHTEDRGDLPQPSYQAEVTAARHW